MKIKWLGHASFLITADSGAKIITDPYIPDDRLHYGDINESADVVTVSHDHSDHGSVAAVKGGPQVVKGDAEIKGIIFKGIPAFHDAAGGRDRGKNTIFCFEVDGVKVCHLGDLGHELTAEQVAAIGAVDVLLMPVGGFYTIDANVASRVAEQLKPRVVIPMHFKNERCDFPISSVAEFLRGMHQAGKPIGAICIAPVILARVFGNEVPLEITIGKDAATAEAINKMGAKHVEATVTEWVIDDKNKIVTTPAYMLAERISELIEELPPSPEVPEEYLKMEMTEECENGG